MKDENLFQQFAYTDWLIRKYHQSKLKLEGPAGSTLRGQGKLLAVLYDLKQISQNKLLEIMNIRQQSLGELLAKLEKSEYIVRMPAQDRRTMNIIITEKGINAAPQKLNPDEIFGCLTMQEQQQFSEYLLRVTAHLRNQLGDEADDFRAGRHHPHSADKEHHHNSLNNSDNNLVNSNQQHFNKEDEKI